MKKTAMALVMGAALYSAFVYGNKQAEERFKIRYQLANLPQMEDLAEKYHDQIVDISVYGIYKYPAEVYSRCIKQGIDITKEKIHEYRGKNE